MGNRWIDYILRKRFYKFQAQLKDFQLQKTVDTVNDFIQRMMDLFIFKRWPNSRRQMIHFTIVVSTRSQRYLKKPLVFIVEVETVERKKAKGTAVETFITTLFKHILEQFLKDINFQFKPVIYTCRYIYEKCSHMCATKCI